MKQKILILILLITVASLVPAVGQNYGGYYSERITSFHSDITVHKDATMTVTETIKVIAANDKIKRGIYRDFPTRYRDKSGRPYIVGFDVTDVKRNGRAEPYHIERISNGKRVYIGQADVMLSPGAYTYQITYKTSRQLGFFKDYDELYWNVTGNGWEFPIDKASATVVLPKEVPASSIKVEGYTGPTGSNAQDYNASVDSAGRSQFRTTKQLWAEEGMTIVVSWQKGIVIESNHEPFFQRLLTRNYGILALIGLLLVLTYNLYIWTKLGRDPRRGTIIPLYTPPLKLSPASIRYISRMGYDNRIFASAIINMAIKGYVRIKEHSKFFTVIRDKADESVLTPDEKLAASKLLGSNDSIDLQNINYARIGSAISGLRKHLADKYQKQYFSMNSIYIIPGAVVSLLVLLLSGFIISSNDIPAAVGGVFSMLSTFITLLVMRSAGRSWRLSDRSSGSKVKAFFKAFFLTLLSIPLLAGSIVLLVVLGENSSGLYAFSLTALVVASFIFFHLFKAPTEAGRKLIDEIEGFKMYLSVAEKDTLSTAALSPEAPEKTPELYEQYLPYALALGVEQAWSEKFSDVLEQLGEEYRPTWYDGNRRWNYMYAGAFASSIGDSFSSAISSSSTAPGSSSGSGGGGSSGGGGGGGGGGGW